MRSFIIVYTLDGVRYYDSVSAASHADAVNVFELAFAMAGLDTPSIEHVQAL